MKLAKSEFNVMNQDDFFALLDEHKVINVIYVNKNRFGESVNNVYRASKSIKKSKFPATKRYSKLHKQGYPADLVMLEEIGKKALQITGTKDRFFYIYK